MRRLQVSLNHAGMKALLNDPGVRRDLTRRMQPVLQQAIDDPHDDTGDYERGLHIEQVTTDRAVVRVVSGDWKGHILEAEYGILGRALDAAGGS